MFAEPEHTGAKEVLTEVLTRLGYGSECATWRNNFLVGASEIDGPPHPAEVSAAGMATALTITQIFDSIAIRIDGPRAWDVTATIRWHFTDVDETYRMELSHGVLIHYPTTRSDPTDLVVELTTPQLLDLLAGSGTDAITMEGDATAITRIVELTDAPPTRRSPSSPPVIAAAHTAARARRVGIGRSAFCPERWRARSIVSRNPRALATRRPERSPTGRSPTGLYTSRSECPPQVNATSAPPTSARDPPHAYGSAGRSRHERRWRGCSTVPEFIAAFLATRYAAWSGGRSAGTAARGEPTLPPGHSTVIPHRFRLASGKRQPVPAWCTVGARSGIARTPGNTERRLLHSQAAPTHSC